MIGEPYFYNATIRRANIVFGALFSKLKIRRDKGNNDFDEVSLPIRNTMADKFRVRNTDVTELDGDYVRTTNPRMTYTMTGVAIDLERKTGQNTIVVDADTQNNMRRTTMTPLPYELNFSLNIRTDTMDDMLQVVEQILPFFHNSLTLEVNDNVDIVKEGYWQLRLDTVDLTDLSEGDIEEIRELTVNMNFTMSIELFRETVNSRLITTATVDVDNIPGDIDYIDIVET